MKCWVKGRTIYFDDEASEVIKRIATRRRRTFRQIVIEALTRGFDYHEKRISRCSGMESKQVSRRVRPKMLAVVKKTKGVS